MSCPLTPETHHIVNAERLALMKPTAYLINTARGPIVDQKALTEVLQERRIAGAGLDVLEQEPPDPDDPILKLDNVILAPHALCWTDQCFAGNGAADVKAVLEVQHGRVPRGVVNRDGAGEPTFGSVGWRRTPAACADGGTSVLKAPSSRRAGSAPTGRQAKGRKHENERTRKTRFQGRPRGRGRRVCCAASRRAATSSSGSARCSG